MRFMFLIPVILLVGMLAGCGQKGPLYLPADNSSTSQASDHQEAENSSAHPARGADKDQQPSDVESRAAETSD